MPFDFLKRKKEPEAAAPTSDAETAVPGLSFEGLTEDWRLVGRMLVSGRMSDALNKREPIAIADVSWAPTDDSEPLAPAPGLKSIDPYDLVIVLTDGESLPDSEDERTAHRVHKISYEVALEVPPYRVIGTVYLYPGSEPDSLLMRSSDMFVPIVDASALVGNRPIGSAPAILVNRQYLRDVAQVDLRTGEPHTPLPGASMGGVNWTDRSR